MLKLLEKLGQNTIKLSFNCLCGEMMTKSLLNQFLFPAPIHNTRGLIMGKTITEKILTTHITQGKPEKGKEVGIKIDQTLTQDATGTMAYLQFEAMNVPNVKTELSVSYVDHNTVQIGFENADDHRYLQSVAAKYGIVYSRAGNGTSNASENQGKPS
jgi:aconitase B